jgi:hypothetical protein
MKAMACTQRHRVGIKAPPAQDAVWSTVEGSAVGAWGYVADVRIECPLPDISSKVRLPP